MNIKNITANRSLNPFHMIDGGTLGMRPSHFPVFDKDDGTGSPDDTGGDDAEAVAAALAAKGGKKPTEQKSGGEDIKEAARLARDLAKKDRALTDAQTALATATSQLERFKDIDPDSVRELMASAAVAKAAAEQAEEDRLRSAGDYEALKRRMAEQHEQAIKAERDVTAAANASVAALNKQIREITIGAAFSASSFIRDNTVLPSAKARRAYDDHFEIKDGQVFAYDRPATDANREPLVDARGKPLPFEEAIRMIVEADEDRDHILRSSHKSGSGQAPVGKVVPGGETKLTGVSAIAAALRKQRSPK